MIKRMSLLVVIIGVCVISGCLNVDRSLPDKEIEFFSYSIAMQSTLSGWAYNNHVRSDDIGLLHSRDFGQTWTSIDIDPELLLHAKLFFDEDKVWIYNADEADNLLFSVDVEASGREIVVPPLKERWINDLFWLDDRLGWIVSSYRHGLGYNDVDIYRTVDGGETWELLASTELDDVLHAGEKGGIVFSDENNGWLGANIVTDSELWIYGTSDGGLSWEKQLLPWPSHRDDELLMYQVGKPQLSERPKIIVETGLPGEDQAILFIYEYESGKNDGHWTLINTLHIANADHALSEVRFTDAMRGWFHNGSQLYRTEDGGLSWQVLWQVDQHLANMRGGEQYGEKVLISDVEFVDEVHAILVARSAQQSYVFETKDGAKSWHEIKPKYR